MRTDKIGKKEEKKTNSKERHDMDMDIPPHHQTNPPNPFQIQILDMRLLFTAIGGFERAPRDE